MSNIECKNLSFNYYDKKGRILSKIFNNLNVTFLDKKINVLLGESGCGKSTLMHILCGLNENYEGEIYINNVDARTLTIRKRKISYVTQDIVLYPHLTIFDNIASPLKYDDEITPEEIKIRVRNIAKMLKIEHCLSRRPKHLSYGQQQRVMLAKAFVKDPEIVLLDEAFTGVDEQTKEDLIKFVKEWKEELDATLIVVTHDYKEVLNLADVVMIVENGGINNIIKKEEIKDNKNPTLLALKSASVMEDLK